MAGIRVKEHEPFDVALRRFKRSVEKSGILSEVRRRESFVKKSVQRKRALAAAVRRHRKRLQREVQDLESTRRKS
ncbi:MAG: 30S ribosomal protein S21 [Pseudomonadota bacterium]